VLLLSPFLVREVERVLKYPRVQLVYRLTDADIQEHIEYRQSLGEIVAPTEGPPIIFKCPDDDRDLHGARGSRRCDLHVELLRILRQEA
jgi:hypothetical protein